MDGEPDADGTPDWILEYVRDEQGRVVIEETDEDGDGVVDDPNPRYVKGLCLATPLNLSGTTPVNCVDSIDACAANLFPYDDLLADIESIAIARLETKGLALDYPDSERAEIAWLVGIERATPASPPA